METKICSKCGEEKLATTEFFHKAIKGKCGLKAICKACSSQYNKKQKAIYYKNNKEEILKRNENWRKENKEVYARGKKTYYENNKEEILEKMKKYRDINANDINYRRGLYRANNVERIKEQNKRHYNDNKEKIKRYVNAWVEENKDKSNYYKLKCQQQRRALKAQLPSTLTDEQWDNAKQHFSNGCAYCGIAEKQHIVDTGQQLHQDHFIPLTRGGGYTVENIIPSCRSCNCSKNDKDFFEWYPTYEHYDSKRETFVLKYLNYTTEKTQQLALM